MTDKLTKTGLWREQNSASIWRGCDFAAAIENDGVWSKIKQALPAKELATMPLSVLKSAGVALLEQYAKAKLGL
jgi:hypothetical protein